LPVFVKGLASFTNVKCFFQLITYYITLLCIYLIIFTCSAVLLQAE